MSYIQTIREAIDATLDRVQHKAEAAELQASLGRMELEDRIGEEYRKLTESAGSLMEKLNEAGISEASVQQALDRMQLQLALGGMESRDAIERLKREFDERVNEFNRALDGIDVEQIEEQTQEIEIAVRDYMKKMVSVEAQLDARADRVGKDGEQ